jgi:hypothetical protein
MAVKKPSVSEWFRTQLREQLRLEEVEGGEPFRRALASFPVLTGVKAAPTPLTGGLRYMSRFLKTRMRFPIGHEGYSCVVLGLKTRRARSIFGLALWRSGAEAGDPEYICASPTFESRDGEYRHRLVGFPVFAAAFAELAGPLAPFEDAILAEVGRGRLELTATAYPDRAAPDLVEACERLRLPVIALAALLAIETASYATQMIVEHTNEAFVKCFQDIIEAAPGLEDASRKIWFSETERSTLRRFITGSPAVDTGRNEPELGVKAVPMLLREVMQPFDLNLAAWREASVMQVASDLSLNLITPSFGVFGGWTYVEGTDAGLFENRAMAEKFARGAAAAGAAEGLREARRRLEEAPPGFRARDLGARLYETIEYAQSHLVLSEVAMLFAQEHVGITLGSAPLFARRDPFARPALRDFAASRDGAARLLFEWAYAAHCLHAKAGVAHCDLHENNLTLHIWGGAGALAPHKTEAGAVIKGREAPPIYGAATPVTFFVTGARGELDTFVFPTSGLGGHIIDYSRAVLGPAYRPRLEAGHDPLYATNFYRDQVNRAMRVLHRYSGDFVRKNQEALKAVAIADFGALFPVLCAVDFIAVGAAFASALEKAAARDLAERGDPARPGLGAEGRHLRPLAIDPAAVPLARRLEAAGREALVAGLLDLVHGGRGGAGGGAAAPPPWPGESVLPKVFGGWRYPRWVERTQAERLAARPGRADRAEGGAAAEAAEAAEAAGGPPAPGAGAGGPAAAAAAPPPEGPRPPPAFLISSLPPGPVLVDVYNFNNPLEHSGADYARFPPWARLDRIEPHLGDLKMTDLFERGPEPFFVALKPGVRPEVLAAQLRAEEERLDGRAVSTASSWLEEA